MKARQLFRYKERQHDFIVEMEQLLNDFKRDCTDLAGWKWR